MLRSAGPLLVNGLRRSGTRYIGSAQTPTLHHPNAPIELDPSFQALLKDADMSIRRHKHRPQVSDHHHPPLTPRELELYPNDPLAEEDLLSFDELELQDSEHDAKKEQKSPAAHFGSRRIGAVILPSELEKAINQLIAEYDKPRLHENAKRLFLDDTGDEPEWDTAYNVHYRSPEHAARHAKGDGTAFATVALPAHYSAIRGVLEHVKQRLGPSWDVKRVVDWGSGAGSGLWASSHVFQKTVSSDVEHTDLQIANTTVTSYIGIDKRMGLTNVAQRLTESVKLGELEPTWQKLFSEEDLRERAQGSGTVALSAFVLSSLPSPLARKALVKEMWGSGAEVLILIDHNTKAGFESIVEARETLLRYGRKELDDPYMAEEPIKGCHVVAPCPHDGACPLHHPGSIQLVCGFSQRLQRPQFIRKTKHSGIGHEDIEYSYVVIRRGLRPTPPASKVGRVGEVGRRELEKAEAKRSMTELVIDDEHPHLSKDAIKNAAKFAPQPSDEGADHDLADEELQAALRAESYSWPRLIFPPLKKSGHIILDGCTADAKIMRMTIPKSQGKQPFYDARKSSWGDIFPHDPKNPPQERYQPKRAGNSKTVALKGGDIGKRANSRNDRAKTSYAALSLDIKEKKRKNSRRHRDYSEDDGWSESDQPSSDYLEDDHHVI